MSKSPEALARLAAAGSTYEETDTGPRITNPGRLNPNPAPWVREALDEMWRFVDERIIKEKP